MFRSNECVAKIDTATTRGRAWLMFLLLIVVATPSRAATVLLFDDFDAAALDTNVWALPVGPPSFLGRTQMRPPGQEPVLENGAARLRLDTFNPTSIAEPTFFGSEFFSKSTFGPGVRVTVRSRFVAPVSVGTVGSAFLFITDGAVRDELDFELLGNDANANVQRVLTNAFDNDDFSQPGNKSFATAANFSLTEFNDYSIVWTENAVRWFINDTLVRTETDTVPDEPMRVHVNFWAPDANFSEAFSALLQATDNESENLTFFYEVDSIRVEEVPLPPSVGLLGAACLVLTALHRRRLRRAAIASTH